MRDRAGADHHRVDLRAQRMEQLAVAVARDRLGPPSEGRASVDRGDHVGDRVRAIARGLAPAGRASRTPRRPRPERGPGSRRRSVRSAGPVRESANSPSGSVYQASGRSPTRPVLAFQRLARELARDLGADLLARFEADVHLERVDAGAHLLTRPQPHLDPSLRFVVERDVLEPLRVEVGTEVRVDHVQQVPVELGRHAGGVVVRRLEPRAVLDEVGADQQPVIGVELAPQRLQETPPLGLVEVPDRAAQERDQPAAGSGRDLGRGGARSRPRRRGSRDPRTARPAAARTARRSSPRRRPARSASRSRSPPSAAAARPSCGRSRGRARRSRTAAPARRSPRPPRPGWTARPASGSTRAGSVICSNSSDPRAS